MPQTLLCVVGVVAYVATLCVTLTYGYLALGRAYEADMTSHHDRVVPVTVTEAASDETFAEAASTGALPERRRGPDPPRRSLPGRRSPPGPRAVAVLAGRGAG